LAPTARRDRQLNESLNQTCLAIGSLTDSIATTSCIVADATSEQAFSLEETSSSVNELASIAEGNTEHARQVQTKMVETRKVIGSVSKYLDSLTTP